MKGGLRVFEIEAVVEEIKNAMNAKNKSLMPTEKEIARIALKEGGVNYRKYKKLESEIAELIQQRDKLDAKLREKHGASGHWRSDWEARLIMKVRSAEAAARGVVKISNENLKRKVILNSGNGDLCSIVEKLKSIFDL